MNNMIKSSVRIASKIKINSKHSSPKKQKPQKTRTRTKRKKKTKIESYEIKRPITIIGRNIMNESRKLNNMGVDREKKQTCWIIFLKLPFHLNEREKWTWFKKQIK